MFPTTVPANSAAVSHSWPLGCGAYTVSWNSSVVSSPTESVYVRCGVRTVQLSSSASSAME
jgi:hypothetical protein